MTVLKVFSTLALAQASLSASGKERVFEVVNAAATPLYVAAKDSEIARSRVSKHLGVQVRALPPTAPSADQLRAKLAGMSPDEIAELRRALTEADNGEQVEDSQAQRPQG